MSLGGSLGGRLDIGGANKMPWEDSGTVSFGAVNGPAAGNAPSVMASRTALGNAGRGTIMGLEIPTFIALAVLVWYVTEKLDD